MSKYKFLINILMIMKFIYYSEAVDFKDIFKFKESNDEFKENMIKRGLPFVGESHVEYLERLQQINPLVNTLHVVTDKEYQILMSSIPRINESKESVNNRNKQTELDCLNKHDLQIYTDRVYFQLKSRYPRVYETYEEYTDRMNRFKNEPLIEELFKGLKNHCPNLGELYDEYIEIRSKRYNITGINKSDFENFQYSYPMLTENETDFIKRIENMELDSYDFEGYYEGLWSLFPIFAETYSEYSDRMEKKWLVPMKRESFIIYQAYYPNFNAMYDDYNNIMTSLSKNSDDRNELNRFQSLRLEIHSKEIFEFLKSQFPKPFESQKDFDNRILIKVYNRYFAKRMYPRMSEAYKEYQDRIESIFFPDQTEISAENYNNYKFLWLKPISEISFVEFKKIYPQFNQLHKEIKYLATEVSLIDQRDYMVLINNLPGVFETYPYYSQRMFMNGLDEEEFIDLKRIYIQQCETYADYKIRMRNLQIKPMTKEDAFKLKISVPREFEKDYETYFELLESSQKQIQNYKDDPILHQKDSLFFIGSKIAKKQVIAFNKTRHTIFKFIHPCAFENYENYKKRINVFREDYDFRDSENIESDELENFRSFIQPLTKEEFMDLKLRFPKLSETHEDYLKRFTTYGFDKEIETTNKNENLFRRYNIQLTILNNPYIQLFNIFKHAQIQPQDNPDSYSDRYKRIALNKSVLLEKMHIPLRQDYCVFESFLESLEKNDYEDIMNLFPKYYDTFQEYNDLMKDRGLQLVSSDYFKMLKSAYPHLLDNNFDDYITRIKNGTYFPKNILIMTQDQFDQFKFRIPKRFETISDYKTRIADASTDLYTPDDIERLKCIYPKVCSTFSEFSKIMNDLGMPMITQTFNFYNDQFPKRGENDYKKFCSRLKFAKSIAMSEKEFNLLISRFPKAPEIYHSYKQRLQLLFINPLDLNDFYDLKNLFSIPYETYDEHYKRLTSYSREPLSLDQFKKEKSLRVLVGETFTDHLTRIIDIYYPPEENSYTESNIITLSNNEGIETLKKDKFIDHVLTYPFNYDSFENFSWRQYTRNSDTNRDPNVTTRIWYDRMKKLLPGFHESIDIYRNRTKELEFPEITVKQFNRHILEMPHPAETFLVYTSRTKDMASSYNSVFFNIPKSAVRTQIPQSVLDMGMSISTPQQNPSKSEMLQRTQLTPIDLSEIRIESYNTLISLSPNFYINYTEYVKNVKEYGDPMSRDELIAFKECLPKLQDSFLKFNENIKSMGLATINKGDFKKLKIFYPRIHHISYDDYILDIELKYADKNNDREQIIDVLKLSNDEFVEYKRKLPKQFDWCYETYQNRMKTEDISGMLTQDDFYGARLANFPLADEDYTQHKAKMDSLYIDPIPYDVFNFLKRIYPDLLENRYAYRIRNMVYKVLKPPDYTKNKYKSNMDNNIISEIIESSKPYEKLEEKIENLLIQMMTDEELDWLKRVFPVIFHSYKIDKTYQTMSRTSQGTQNINKDYMDEMIYKSFKKAYFVSINETYEKYETRMKSLKLIAFPRNIFRYCKAIYPHLFHNYQSYLDNVNLYEKIELRNVENYISASLNKWGLYTLSKYAFKTFQAHFPRVFDTSIKTEKLEKTISIFNHDEFDSIKLSYFPRLAENHSTYKERMIKLGLGVMNTDLFFSFKAIYPNPITAISYSNYEQSFKNIASVIKPVDEQFVDIRHIMTEEEFKNSIPHDFPKLFESWETFCQTRLNLYSQTSRLINDSGVFSENLFNDMKTVFYPILGQKSVSYLLFVDSLSILDNPSWNHHFKNAILLYPKFFENIDNYNERLQQNPLEYLKLDKNQFHIFFQIFPFPYESYPQYKIRKANSTLILSEEEFSFYQQVFPQISEPYFKYSSRLNVEIYYNPVMSLQLFKLYKELLPQIDENYDKYKNRFVTELQTISDSETKNQLSFFVQNMHFSAMNYETSKALNTRTSGPAMTYDEFKLFKDSLPMPEELREDYIFRINKLADMAKENDKVPPEILPFELFENLKKIYPNQSETDYKIYLKNMENINVTPVSENTFKSLVEVAKSMILNRYTVYEKEFTNLVDTRISE
ncbi:uncharacterized protein LOC132931772 isoform X2 [Rhopalosiphum padi]|uniref:uncharacterized protein LOC132931772 isoform X2 n=1 Tax=Rhopalosiphum padi TaxID=40932 RepID=UPI00298E5910|nr:uncharacterized protein LOC132931772 isoform X2 [Rhopalosiphum padi]